MHRWNQNKESPEKWIKDTPKRAWKLHSLILDHTCFELGLGWCSREGISLFFRSFVSRLMLDALKCFQFVIRVYSSTLFSSFNERSAT